MRKTGAMQSSETYYLRLMNQKGVEGVIGYYGEAFCAVGQYLKLEYLDMTIEDYIARKDIPGKRTLPEIAGQMLQCLQNMH